MAKLIQFFKEVWAELRKVVWPTRQQTIKYTAVVIVFSVALAVILGAVDLGLSSTLEKVINR